MRNPDPHRVEGPGNGALVSVVMPAYNGAAFVREAIESALQQTHANMEIVVVDDGSSDDTQAICRSFGPPVRVFAQPNDGTHGIGARSRAILEARGDWIAPLDQDDRWRPDKIERQLQRADEEPEAAVIFTGWRIITTGGEPTGEVRPAGPEGWVLHDLLQGDPYCHSSALIRRAALVRCGLPDADLACADWDLFLRIARRFPVAACPEALTDYRIHQQNWSRNPDPMSRAQLACIRRQSGRLHPECRECRRLWRATCYRLLLYRYELAAQQCDDSATLRALREVLGFAPFRLIRPRFALHLLQCGCRMLSRRLSHRPKLLPRDKLSPQQDSGIRAG